MRIVILAAGTWGDVRPNVVLGQALQKAGYEVLLVGAEGFRRWVEARNLPFAGLSVNIQDILDKLVASDTGPIATIRTLREINREFGPAAVQMGQELAAVVRDGDVLLMNENGSSLMNGVVEKYNLRLIHINFQPQVPTREFPGMGVPSLPDWMPLRDRFNRFSYNLVRRGGWSMMGKRGNELRTEHLDMPKQSWRNHREMIDSTPSLLLVSPHVLPRPADWSPHHRVTGYVFDEDSDWQPPHDLLDFLDAGDKPVYIGFGSMRVRQPEATTRLVLDAVQRTGKRAILLIGWAGIGTLDLPEDVFILNYAPHLWLFPRMAAVIHHGGSGTTAAGLLAGVPTVVVPILADQPYWGQRVYKLGVGTKPLNGKKLTAEKLAAAIIEATTNPTIQANVTALSQKIAAEDGVGEAVKAIKAFLT